MALRQAARSCVAVRGARPCSQCRAPLPRRPFSSGGGASDAVAQAQASMRQCVESVRRQDRENYLIASMAPPSSRAAFFVLRAWNNEVARIKDSVTEAHMGAIRFQWWRDTIEEMYQQQPEGAMPQLEHPVARVLALTVARHSLSKRWLLRSLAAREADFSALQPDTVAAMQEYAERTASSLLYLYLESLGVRSVDADHAASHIGKAVGLVTMLRATPHLLQRRQLYLPADMLPGFRPPESGTMGEADRAALARATAAVADVCEAQLDHARTLRARVPAAAHPALLHAVPASRYLRRLRRYGCDLFHPALQRDHALAPVTAHAALLWHAARRHY